MCRISHVLNLHNLQHSHSVIRLTFVHVDRFNFTTSRSLFTRRPQAIIYVDWSDGYTHGVMMVSRLSFLPVIVNVGTCNGYYCRIHADARGFRRTNNSSNVHTHRIPHVFQLHDVQHSHPAIRLTFLHVHSKFHDDSFTLHTYAKYQYLRG